MKISIFKIINISLLILFVAVYLSVNYYWNINCSLLSCTEYIIDRWLNPMRFGSLALLPSFIFLLFFPARIFKYWLFGLFSWLLPLSIFFISQVNINSSFILSPQPGQLAWFLGEIIFLITIIYTLVIHLYLFWRHKITKRNLLLLLLLIPAIIAWKVMFRL